MTNDRLRRSRAATAFEAVKLLTLDHHARDDQVAPRSSFHVRRHHRQQTVNRK